MTHKTQPNRHQSTSQHGRVVFDLDGTLIDSAPDIQGIANAGLEKIGFAPITLEETHKFIGAGIQNFIEQMRDSRGIPDRYQETLLQDITARYDTAVELTVMSLVSEKPSNFGAISSARICTNKLQTKHLHIEALKIDQFFKTVWGGDNALARKPDPAPLQAAFDDLGTGVCIFVGDSEVDAETARRAEVPFILFTHGYRNSRLNKFLTM